MARLAVMPSYTRECHLACGILVLVIPAPWLVRVSVLLAGA
jgi:hypothetical protein